MLFSYKRRAETWEYIAANPGLDWDTLSGKTVLSILAEKNSWMLHCCSIFKTKLNTFEALTNIEHVFAKARNGLNVGAFEDRVLEKTLGHNAEDM
jgi:hypothetical protein